MNLEKFLSVEVDYILSPEEVQSLNEDLVNVSALDIPINYRAQVVDYLISALNMNSVKHEIIPALDLLLSELQIHT